MVSLDVYVPGVDVEQCQIPEFLSYSYLQMPAETIISVSTALRKRDEDSFEEEESEEDKRAYELQLLSYNSGSVQKYLFLHILFFLKKFMLEKRLCL